MNGISSPRNWSQSGTAIEVFFDGDCPLCRREVNFLLKRDRDERIVATNIAAPNFDPSVYGRSYSEFMATIQGRLDDGTWVSGVEVFRQLYSAIGLTRLVRFSRMAPIGWVLSFAYSVFAKNRLRLTGRCTDGACAMPNAAANDNKAPLLLDTGAKVPSLEERTGEPSQAPLRATHDAKRFPIQVESRTNVRVDMDPSQKLAERWN